VSDVEQVLRAADRRATALADGDAGALRSLLHPHLRWTTFRGDVPGPTATSPATPERGCGGSASGSSSRTSSCTATPLS
jgi:hypothetical protein